MKRDENEWSASPEPNPWHEQIGTRGSYGYARALLLTAEARRERAERRAAG